MDRGADFYYATYDQEQLWQMLMVQGDPWSVRQSGQFWKHTRETIELVAAALGRHLAELADYWQGSAANRYQTWMGTVAEALGTAGEGMSFNEKHLLAEAAAALEAAQDDAVAAGLDPAHWTDLDGWVEDHWGPLDGLSERQLREAHAAFRDEQRHRLAELVGELGQRYRTLIADSDRRMPSIAQDLPGADTYEPLHGGAVDRQVALPAPTPQPEPEPAPGTEDEPEDAPLPVLMSYDDIDRPLIQATRAPALPTDLFGKAPTGYQDMGTWNHSAMTAAAELGRRLAREKGTRPAAPEH